MLQALCTLALGSAPALPGGATAQPADATMQSDRRELTAAEARAIAHEAYVYGFPLVDNYRIMHAYFVDRAQPEFKAPWNQVYNNDRVYTPADRQIQSPNSDTPYSNLGADLRAEPLVLTFPVVEPGRYYSAQFIDLYTHNFAYVGSRATGNGGGSFLLAGPGWRGNTPPGIRAVIRSETEFAKVFYRTQLFGPDDMDKVRRVQAGYTVQTLSQFLGKTAPAAAPPLQFVAPLTADQQRSSPRFFEILDFVLRFCPTHPSEQALRARFARLGIGAGGFDAQALAPAIRAAIEQGMADAWRESYAGFERLRNDGKVSSAVMVGTREYLQNNYLYRMAAAVGGIYANSKEEAVYASYYVDAGGEALVGSNQYLLRFAPDRLPPVNAFWSVTVYELPSRTLVANPIDRYVINSAMLADLVRDADGGLTLCIQHQMPHGELRPNWLPAPRGPFFAGLRLYWPKPEALDGRWTRPPLQLVRESGSTGRSEQSTGVPVAAATACAP